MPQGTAREGQGRHAEEPGIEDPVCVHQADKGGCGRQQIRHMLQGDTNDVGTAVSQGGGKGTERGGQQS